jgi:UDP-glucose 4-epimerase
MSNNTQPTILVTGAAGHLGSHLIPMLLSDGMVVRGMDMAEPETPLPEACDFTQVDLADRDTMRGLLDGVDAIVHTASLHPWKSYTDDQYIDANVKGTWTLYALAAEMGIDKIVLTSSIAAIGYNNIPMDVWPVREDALFPLSDIYSYTKYTQETIAKLRADAQEVRTFAIRPPAFMPRSPLDTCLSMIGAFAVVEDIAAAHLAAVRVLTGLHEPGGPIGWFEAFHTVNALPYTPELIREVNGDPGQLVKRCWPDAYAWLVENGYGEQWAGPAYDIAKARRILAWKPTFNFEQAYAALLGD